MNELSINNVVKMSSREIAEVTGKKHHHVKRDIEVMFHELQTDVSRFGHIFTNSMNRQQQEYMLPKRETYIPRWDIQMTEDIASEMGVEIEL